MTKKKEITMIVICWLSYIMAQLGRYSYATNVTLIMDRFAVDHAEASLPVTLFFFAYGLGQILIGIFCHKYNRKLIIFFALVVSAVINFVIFFGVKFFTIKYLWLINGFAQANLWPVLLLILKENLSVKRIAAAGIVMSTASTGGKFVAIGVCAIFAVNTSLFMYCFLTSGIMLIAVALLFIFAIGKLKDKQANENSTNDQKVQKTKEDKKNVVLLLVLGEFALACYAISGGLQSWVPAIIKENYGKSDALSIFLSILLPLFTLPVAIISPFLYKKLKNYALVCLLSFCLSTILIIGILSVLYLSWIILIIVFTMEVLTMGVVSNITTVQVPFTFKGKFDAGLLAGYLNGACYVGMAISTYVLGYMADSSGWKGAFIVLMSVSAVSTVLAAAYLIFSHKKANDNYKDIKS